MTFKQIVCVLHFQKKQLPLLLHRVICKYIHTSWLCEQNAMDREVRYTAVSIRNSQYLPLHCSNVIRKTKMPLSTFILLSPISSLSKSVIPYFPSHHFLLDTRKSKTCIPLYSFMESKSLYIEWDLSVHLASYLSYHTNIPNK